MKATKCPHLTSPIRLGNVFFRNRIFSAPMGTTDITPLLIVVQALVRKDFMNFVQRVVHLVEMRDVLAADCNIRHKPILMKQVEKYAVSHLGHTGLRITEDGVICAVGQRANRADVDALRLSAPFVREVGDCVRPANITKAVYEGYHAALDI